MEALLLGGLVLLGNAINKRKDEIPLLTKNPEKFNDISKNNSLALQPEINQKSNQMFYQISQEEYKKSHLPEYPIVDNVIESLPNSSFVQQDIPQKRSALDDLFQPLNIQNVGGATAYNQAPLTIFGEDQNLKRQIEFMEGFSEINKNANYGITKNFTHNNMIPSTNQRDFALPNFDNMNTRLDLYTGSSRDWQPKVEVERLFQPLKIGGYEEPRVSIDASLSSRFIPSFKNNMGNLPFKNKVKVKPGILDQNQEGRHATYRINPRNIDELRGENRKQQSYHQPVIESGLRGRAPQTIGEVKTSRPQEFKITTEIDFQPVKGTYSKAVPRGRYFISANTKAQHMEVKGPAHLSSAGNRVDRNYIESSKISYSTEDNLGPATSLTQGSKVGLYSQVTFENQRDTTNYVQKGHLKGEISSTYANQQDDVRNTIKETTLYSQKGFIGGEIPATYTNQQDNVRTTTKETTIYTQEGFIGGDIPSTYANLQDQARNTIKETTMYTQKGHLQGEIPSTYANLQDQARNTIKETTMYTQKGHLQGEIPSTYANLQDEARGTIKETTLYTQKGYLKSEVPAVYANLQDQARITIKETTLAPKEFRFKGENSSYAIDRKDVAKPTIKHTTMYTQEGHLGSRIDRHDARIKDDKTRTTIKETTLLEGYTGGAGDTTTHKQRAYDDALNMEHTDCREKVLESHPNPGGAQKIGARYHREEADTRKRMFINAAREPNLARPLDYQTPDACITDATRWRDSSTNYDKNYRVNDNFINTLASNPYVNDIRHQKNHNVKFNSFIN